jgi:TonB family protein
MALSRLFLTSCLILSSHSFLDAQILREPSIEEPPVYIEKENENRVFDIVEEMPVFVKEGEDINTFLAKNINYPLECKEEGIQGTVYIKFIVQAAGGIRDIKVMRSPKECNMLEKEAIRVVKLSENY